MNQDKRNRLNNSKEANMIALDLKEGVEIKQKVEYYKSILKAYDSLSKAIDEKIVALSASKDGAKAAVDIDYEIAKLSIEKIEANSTLYEKRKFFEMWLGRLNEYEQKSAIITEDCNKNFDEVQAQARTISENNIKLKSYMTKYDMEDADKKNQEMKNEYYLLLKYEITKITGKGKILTTTAAN